MRVITNESVLKEKKHRKPISEGGKGGGGPIPYDARYKVTAMLNWHGKRAVKVFAVN